MTSAVCPGSFDPITLGHLDIIRRAAACFAYVWVCVSSNADKRTQMFTPEQKLLLVQAAVAPMPNVRAELWPGLVADYAAARQAAVIVRGVRNGSDFDAEHQLAMINRDLRPGLETMLIPACGIYQHVSSSMARELIRYRQPLEHCLPEAVVPLVRGMIPDREDCSAVRQHCAAGARDDQPESDNSNTHIR